MVPGLKSVPSEGTDFSPGTRPAAVKGCYAVGAREISVSTQVAVGTYPHGSTCKHSFGVLIIYIKRPGLREALEKKRTGHQAALRFLEAKIKQTTRLGNATSE